MPNPTAPAKRILAIDGGGIRCLIGIEVLAELEQRLALAYAEPGYRLCQHFDLVAGTSGGAIIATAVALGLPMADIRDFVIANARNMFRPAQWYRRYWSLYDKAHLESNMQHWFGADTQLGSDRLRTLLLLVMRNWTTDSPWLVSNNPNAPFNARHLDDCNLNLPLWQLASASAAAPAYYTPQTIRFGREKPYDFVFVDGGLTGFLNPAFKAFLYATTEPYGLSWPAGEDQITLLSIGAGDVRQRRARTPASDITLLGAVRTMPNAMLQASVREQDLLCRSLGRCRTGDPIDLEVGDLHHARSAAEPRLFNYHRINVPLTEAGLAHIGCAQIPPRAVRRIDAVEQVQALSEIGQALAQHTLGQVLPDLLPKTGVTAYAA